MAAMVGWQNGQLRQGGSGRQRQPRRREGAKVAKVEKNRARTGSLGSKEGYKRGRPEMKKVVVGLARGRRS